MINFRYHVVSLVAVFLALAIGVVLGAGNSLIGQAVGHDPSAAQAAGRTTSGIIAWTPFGWPWSAPADAATGHPAAALLKLGATGTVVALLWVAWGRLLARAMETYADGAAVGTVRTGGLVDRLCPPTPTGAVMARSLHYWRRDPRHLTSLVSMLAVPLILTIALRDTPIGPFAAPVAMAAMAGPTLVNEVAQDHSAFWLHVSSGMSMRADRWGRIGALAVILVPLLLVVLVLDATVFAGPDGLRWAVPTTIAVLGVSCGLGALVGGRWPGMAPAPDANPFSTRSGGGFQVALTLYGVWLATALLAAPVAWLAIAGDARLASLLAVALAAGALVGGVRAGAAQLERRAPQILAGFR